MNSNDDFEIIHSLQGLLYFLKSLLSPFGSIEKRGIPFSLFFSLPLQARSRETKESQKNRICRHPQLWCGVPSSSASLWFIAILSCYSASHLGYFVPHDASFPTMAKQRRKKRARAVVDDQKVTRHSCCDRAKRSRPMIQGELP